MKWIQWWDEFILQWMWWVEIDLFLSCAGLHNSKCRNTTLEFNYIHYHIQICEVSIAQIRNMIYIPCKYVFQVHAKTRDSSMIGISYSAECEMTCGWVINDHVYTYLHATFGEMKTTDTFTWFRHGMLLFYFPTCRVVQNVIIQIPSPMCSSLHSKKYTQNKNNDLIKYYIYI